MISGADNHKSQQLEILRKLEENKRLRKLERKEKMKAEGTAPVKKKDDKKKSKRCWEKEKEQEEEERDGKGLEGPLWGIFFRCSQ
jgi:hypothetical protein